MSKAPTNMWDSVWSFFKPLKETRGFVQRRTPKKPIEKELLPYWKQMRKLNHQVKVKDQQIMRLKLEIQKQKVHIRALHKGRTIAERHKKVAEASERNVRAKLAKNLEALNSVNAQNRTYYSEIRALSNKCKKMELRIDSVTRDLVKAEKKLHRKKMNAKNRRRVDAPVARRRRSRRKKVPSNVFGALAA